MERNTGTQEHKQTRSRGEDGATPWIVEELKASLVVILAVVPLGLANTFFQMYLYEH